MERIEFIKTCCQAGLGLCLTTLLGESCSRATYFAQATLESDKISVRKSEFQYLKKEEMRERTHIFVKTASAEFPVCLYKSADLYTACLMRCTHQGCEVELQGNRYVCPCHGSEFSTKGDVLNGPADKPLKSFKTTQDEIFIYIWLA